jgi:hypothetical protein
VEGREGFIPPLGRLVGRLNDGRLLEGRVDGLEGRLTEGRLTEGRLGRELGRLDGRLPPRLGVLGREADLEPVPPRLGMLRLAPPRLAPPRLAPPRLPPPRPPLNPANA